MAKKEKVVLDDFDVKLASSTTSKKNKPDQLLVETKKALVDQAIQKSRNIESLETELAIIECELITVATDAKKKAENSGNFAKTVNLAGEELKIQIQIKDAYSKMDEGMRAPLKEIFKDKYPIMFIDIEDNKLVESEDKIKELKILLGSRWSEFFSTDKAVKPSKEFQQTYFTLRDTLSAKQKDVVKKVIDACQSTPSVKYPK
jgi:hypothetical protein